MIWLQNTLIFGISMLPSSFVHKQLCALSLSWLMLNMKKIEFWIEVLDVAIAAVAFWASVAEALKLIRIPEVVILPFF